MFVSAQNIFTSSRRKHNVKLHAEVLMELWTGIELQETLQYIAVHNDLSKVDSHGDKFQLFSLTLKRLCGFACFALCAQRRNFSRNIENSSDYT